MKRDKKTKISLYGYRIGCVKNRFMELTPDDIILGPTAFDAVQMYHLSHNGQIYNFMEVKLKRPSKLLYVASYLYSVIDLEKYEERFFYYI